MEDLRLRRTFAKATQMQTRMVYRPHTVNLPKAQTQTDELPAWVLWGLGKLAVLLATLRASYTNLNLTYQDYLVLSILSGLAGINLMLLNLLSRNLVEQVFRLL